MRQINIESPENVPEEIISNIARAIIGEKVVILPTSTIYGLSCRFDSKRALNKIYKIKARDAGVPFIILISKISQLNELTGFLNKDAAKLIDHYWNIDNIRPLTLVFKKSSAVPSFVSAGKPTLALRMAGLKILRDIIDITGPIISTSANISGEKTLPVTIDCIPDKIRGGTDLVVSMGSPLQGSESTIVDVAGSKPVLIREGAVRYKEIMEVLKL